VTRSLTTFVARAALSLALCGDGVTTAFAAQEPPGASACERAARLALGDATIAETVVVPAGAFAGPPAPFSGQDLTTLYKSLPAFCRVSATATPTSDSDIKIQVWLPVAGWNGRLLGVGNGGFAGLIDYRNLAAALGKGYAAAATDAGHTGSPIDATWAPGHPEKVADFGHRGIHEMTRVAKETVRAFYGEHARRSYFHGCSDGGREALMEAQRYPDDYDGILAGAPAHNWTALLATAVWDTRALTLDPASFIPPEKIPAIAAAVNAACDGLDGVKDGILADPRGCHFDPATIQCRDTGLSDACLTAPQVVALRAIYEGPRDADGKQVFPGYPPGAEEGGGGWVTWITGRQPKTSLMALFGLGYFSQMVYGRPDWDFSEFALAADLRTAVEKTAQALDATDTDLTRFRARGGKLILYHGWQDPAIPAVSTVDYYDAVVRRMGKGTTDAFVRLYMAPGMQHCGDGPGPDAFGQAGEWSSDDPGRSLRVALERWVEGGAAPSSVIAAKYAGEGPTRRVTMLRPVCPHPQVARYAGTGDTNDAGTFACVAPTTSSR
jgi:feruloyl esterase